MVQNSDGRWSHKPGEDPSEQLPVGKNPSNVDWSLKIRITNGPTTYNKTIKKFYTTKIVYLAIMRY